MQIILLRHGTRDYGIGDRPLNEDGLIEASEFARHPIPLQATHLFSSPKKRANMTLQPLSTKLNLPIVTHPDLNQQHSRETEGDFSQRVKHYIDSLSELIKESETFIICSHSDWLSMALSHIPSNELSPSDYFFQCAEFMTFSLNEGLWIKEDP